MNVSFSGVVVSGIATALPKDKFEISSLGHKFGDNEIKRIMLSTGIKSVRIAQAGLKISDLCCAATTNLLNACNLSADDIDGIIVVSQSHDAIMPATSVMLQHYLGLNKNTVAFDISYGCSGYIYGLYQASMLITSGGCNRVLLFAGDIITPLLDPDDRQVRTVFGDAGSVTLIEKGDDCIDLILKSDGSGMLHLRAEKNIRNGFSPPNYLHMSGAEVMEFALREVPSTIDALLKMKAWSHSDVGTYALHQANYFMLNYLRKKMQLTKEAMPITVENTGNTGSASIPLSLSLTYQRLHEENRLHKVVMSGFGVGWSWGAAGLNLSNTTILGPIDV